MDTLVEVASKVSDGDDFYTGPQAFYGLMGIAAAVVFASTHRFIFSKINEN